jgi:3-phosphoshikimate 1-carboxyvinyltransferase
VKSSVARGTVTAPPSKSYTHRAMVLGALTHSHFSLKNALISEDTKATLDALFALGSEVRANTGGVKIFCEQLRASPGVIDARNSGTTIRLIAGVASLLPSRTTLTGDESLVRRPMGPLVDSLAALGAECSYLGKPGCPPLTVKGPISGQRTKIAAGVSSQFVSSLLIACTQKTGPTEIALEGELRSRPYVDITLSMLREFGAHIDSTDSGFKVVGGQKLFKDSYAVPGDYSSAAFPLAAAAITGGDVTVRNLLSESPQGDRAIVNHLKSFGAKVVTTPESVRVIGDNLEGTEIDVRHTPDLFPILAVLGCAADGRTVLKGAENLREKESDRISTTVGFLTAMGARIVARKDGCEIIGGEKLHGAAIETEGDHRILMAASVAALASTSETRIDDDRSFAVSYPGFIRDMHQLGCRLEVRR